MERLPLKLATLDVNAAERFPCNPLLSAGTISVPEALLIASAPLPSDMETPVIPRANPAAFSAKLKPAVKVWPAMVKLSVCPVGVAAVMDVWATETASGPLKLTALSPVPADTVPLTLPLNWPLEMWAEKAPLATVTNPPPSEALTLLADTLTAAFAPEPDWLTLKFPATD